MTSRIKKAKHALKIKAGSGKLDKQKIIRAQQEIDSKEFDIISTVQEKLSAITSEISNVETCSKSLITENVMDIKSISGLANHMLVKNISLMILNFLEDLEKLDNSSIQAIKSYQLIMQLVISQDIKKDDEANHVIMLQNELEKTIKKYIENVN